MKHKTNLQPTPSDGTVTQAGFRQVEWTGGKSRVVLLTGLAFALCLQGRAPAETGSADTLQDMAGPDDPVNRVNAAESHAEREALFDFGGLDSFYEAFDAYRGGLYKSTGLKLGGFHSSLFQGATDSLPGQDSTGLATITGLYGTWDAIERGDPSAGQISFGLEGRWGYGDMLTPSQLGTAGIGSATGTSDPYGATIPAVVLRELFWRWGGADGPWNYRIGKITPDRMLTSSAYADPVSMFFPVGSQGSPSVAFPDSGLGMAVGLYPTDRFRVGGLIADANGDRTDFGDIGEGNFFKAIEFQGLPFPLTEKAGFSSVTLWHTDGIDNPADALDSSTGASGWGFFVKLEQELTKDGKNIGMIRYGRSYDGAAAYKEQGSIRYIRLDPPDPFGLADDRFGIAASFAEPLANPLDRNEWGIDMFYRFNLFHNVEASVGYQLIVDPAFNPNDDNVSVFSFRLSQFF